MMDLAKVEQSLTALSSITIGQAKALTDSARRAIDEAIAIAASHKLPGAATRDHVKATLDGHRQVLEGYADASPVSSSALATLKTDVRSAAVELNAAIEGADYDVTVRDQFFSDLVANAKGLAAAAEDAVESGLWTAALVALALAVGWLALERRRGRSE